MRSLHIALYILAVMTLSITGCSNKSASDKTVDIYYLVSTDIVSAINADSTVTYRATLTPEDSVAIKAEMDYVHANMFKEPFNFVSPFYHQFTFDAISLPKEQYDSVYNEVVKEACELFDNYIRTENNGRHFILAGFSQGAMLVQEILKHMDRKTFKRMDAAYALGYKVTEEDLKHPNIRPARNASGKHALISFNTVLSEEGIWPLVAEGTVECINPVNWKTDSTPASFMFNDKEVTISIDPKNHVLMAKTDPAPFHEWMQNPVFKGAGVHEDCLHHWDLLFYGEHIYRNACLRSNIKTTD